MGFGGGVGGYGGELSCYACDNSGDVIDDNLDLSNYSCMHCLCPRQSKYRFIMTVSSLDSKDIMVNEVIPNALRAMDNREGNRYSIILQITHSVNLEDSTSTDFYVIFMSISREVIDALRANNIKKCIFYVGLSGNVLKYSIFNKRPLDKDLAMVDRESVSCPYHTAVIEL